MSRERPHHRLTDAQRQAVRMLLERVTTRDRGYCAYKVGWSDERVAREALPGFEGNGAIVVAKLRAMSFGYLKRAGARRRAA